MARHASQQELLTGQDTSSLAVLCKELETDVDVAVVAFAVTVAAAAAVAAVTSLSS